MLIRKVQLAKKRQICHILPVGFWPLVDIITQNIIYECSTLRPEIPKIAHLIQPVPASFSSSSARLACAQAMIYLTLFCEF